MSKGFAILIFMVATFSVKTQPRADYIWMGGYQTVVATGALVGHKYDFAIALWSGLPTAGTYTLS